MNYSVQNLTTVADCNQLLNWASREKSELEFKKLSDERQTARFAENSQELDAILAGVIAEIAATESIIAMLPEGPTREDAIDRKTRLEYKKFVLENRRESYGSVALLEKEMELARVIKEIEEVEIFISAIEEKRNILQNAA